MVETKTTKAWFEGEVVLGDELGSKMKVCQRFQHSNKKGHVRKKSAAFSFPQREVLCPFLCFAEIVGIVKKHIFLESGYMLNMHQHAISTEFVDD